MKLTKLMILGTLIGATSFAAAQEKPKRPERPVPAEILEKFDADKDGKLSKEEREAARAAREKEFDKDGDGKLSDEEKEAMREDGRKKMIARFDKDGDGKLSEEERKAIPRPPRGERPPGDKPPGEKPAGE
jgi:Ca2+-binding EF-hand superfamily protein